MTSSSSARGWRIGAVILATMAMACGGSDDPFASDGGNNNSADAAPGVDSRVGGNADARVNDAGTLTCAPTPQRFIVLGDSITACVGSAVGGKDSANCGPKIFHEYLKANVNPNITYENVSVPGAVTQDVPDSQIPGVTVGTSGHALVMIFIGGNDLQPYIFISDTAAENRYATDKPRLEGEWDRIYNWLETPSNFPDGVTLIMNKQYNPFDDCTASPYNLSSYKIGLLNEYNDTLQAQSNEREYSVITDQHAPYLGHGHHYQVKACPHYQSGSDNWMADLIHPNVPGHANLAVQWQGTGDAIYASCD